MRSYRAIKIDRALSGGVGKQIFFYLTIVVICFLILMGIAFLLHIPLISEKTHGFGDFWTMLFFFYDGGLEGTQSSNRWFVYLANIVGSILMGGLLIATLTNFLQSRREKAENGLLRYRLSGHTVFIGYHPSMTSLVYSAVGQKDYVVIITELPCDDVRGQFGSLSNRVLVYHGFRTSLKELESLCLEAAREIFVFPNTTSVDTDSENLDVLDMIAGICRDKGRKGLRCSVVFHRDAIASCFERSDINALIRQYVDFTPILYNETMARSLLSGSVFGNQVLDREAIPEESSKNVHLFVFGLGNMGKALFAQAARQLHFPNYEKAKSKITLVGSQAEIQELKSRFREFFSVIGEEYLDLFVQCIPLSSALEIDMALDNAVRDPNSIVTVAVCLENATASLKQAISLPRSIFENAVPVWLYKPDSDAIARLMGTNAYYSNIVPFGNPEKLFVEDKNVLIGQRINWVYFFYTKKGAVPNALPERQEWENEWIPAWNHLSISKKWSNLHHADSFPIKIRSMRLDMETPLTESQLDILSRVEHNRWVVETLLAGYRPPTKEERESMKKDIALKESFKKQLVHLDLSSYEDLLPDANGVDVRDFDRVIEECIPLIMK